MNTVSKRRLWATIGALAGVVLVAVGVTFFAIRDRAAEPGGPPGPTPPGGDTMVVRVYFHQGQADDPARVVPVERTVPRSEQVATAALGQLLAGPTAAERAAGYHSFFSSATADALISVRVANGVARADFKDFSRIIPNASSSYGSAALLAELDATLKQFPTVKSTVYSFEGDVAAFYEWLQLTPPTDDSGQDAAVTEAARAFLTDVAGMNRPVPGPVTRTGSGTAEATFYSRTPDGQPNKALATIVSLRRGGGGWSVTGTRTANILVDQPRAGQAITSPVTVTGRAVAFEGTVTVRVLADGKGEIGRGFVTGGGDVIRPFSGPVTFTPPAAAGSGWLVFFEESAANGEVINATSVRVSFAGQPAAPTIGAVTWQPPIPAGDGWLRLPDGPGTLTVTAEVTGADRVEFYSTPTGTETESLAKLLGTGVVQNGAWTLTWAYPDEPLLAHFSVVAIGPGGRTEIMPFNLYHD
ncbi:MULTISPECIES: Gmad2 immunoglobulin-like domain-containing protein [unclassified Amycolatopsis]|uniref:Gmad2 immunoglobulin-like domain-containing protein n=1 Tax=unclassified Amycolatopsis TaxID=2618356 RepID=UPI000262598E|nr:Gmad2 immunoglobulin-like domain-containing protein [Amycolatopsis sp. ATCC 39116]